MNKLYAYITIGFCVAVALFATGITIHNKAYNKGYSQAELVAAAEANKKAVETNKKIAELQGQIKKLNAELSSESKDFLKKQFPDDIKEAWNDKTLFIN